MALPTTPIRVTVSGTTTTTPTPTTTEMCTSTTRQAAGSSTPAAAGRSHRLASIALTRITGPRHAIRGRAAGVTFTPGGGAAASAAEVGLTAEAAALVDSAVEVLEVVSGGRQLWEPEAQGEVNMRGKASVTRRPRSYRRSCDARPRSERSCSSEQLKCQPPSRRGKAAASIQLALRRVITTPSF